MDNVTVNIVKNISLFTFKNTFSKIKKWRKLNMCGNLLANSSSGLTLSCHMTYPIALSKFFCSHSGLLPSLQRANMRHM